MERPNVSINRGAEGQAGTEYNWSKMLPDKLSQAQSKDKNCFLFRHGFSFHNTYCFGKPVIPGEAEDYRLY
jgi:hypothetical protein